MYKSTWLSLMLVSGATHLTKIFHRKLTSLFFHWQHSTSTMERRRKSTNFRRIAESASVYSLWVNRVVEWIEAWAPRQKNKYNNFLCCHKFLGAHRNVIYSFARSNGNFSSVYFCVLHVKDHRFCCISWYGKPPFCQRRLPVRKVPKITEDKSFCQAFVL